MSGEGVGTVALVQQWPVIHNRHRYAGLGRMREMVPKCFEWSKKVCSWETLLKWVALLPDSAYSGKGRYPMPGLAVRQHARFHSRCFHGDGKHCADHWIFIMELFPLSGASMETFYDHQMLGFTWSERCRGQPEDLYLCHFETTVTLDLDVVLARKDGLPFAATDLRRRGGTALVYSDRRILQPAGGRRQAVARGDESVVVTPLPGTTKVRYSYEGAINHCRSLPEDFVDPFPPIDVIANTIALPEPPPPRGIDTGPSDGRLVSSPRSGTTVSVAALREHFERRLDRKVVDPQAGPPVFLSSAEPEVRS